MNSKAKFVFSAGLFVVSLGAPVYADTITVYMNTTGATPTVSRTADFTSAVNGVATTYTLNQLTFTSAGATFYEYNAGAPNFAALGGSLYVSGGSPSPITISASDGATFYGLQFYIGSGFGQTGAGSTLPIAYELLRGSTNVGSGNFNAVQTASGYLLGFSDASGFTSLEVSDCSGSPCSLSAENALAIEDVSADIQSGGSVPEPGSLGLLATVLIGLGATVRRKVRL